MFYPVGAFGKVELLFSRICSSSNFLLGQCGIKPQQVFIFIITLGEINEIDIFGVLVLFLSWKAKLVYLVWQENRTKVDSRLREKEDETKKH